ncbi:MAG: LamG domain-containing protein, partial [Sedimentisphaerales bacterium]|nr:LamG domain-containing protein [Sedimentisphaerales bacterium]
MCRKMTFLTLVCGLILTNQAVAQDPNLLGWWKLDEKSGNIAYDSGIYGNHGQLIQPDGSPIVDPQWVYGYAGGALWLDGVDDFIEVPHSETLWPDEEATLMAWINTPRYTGSEASAWSGYQAIITKGNDPRMCSLYITTDDEGRGVLHLSVGDSFTGSTSIASVPLNEWVHVCAEVIDGGHLYYINGETSYPADGAGEGSVIAHGEETLRIGGAQENNTFLGKIDDVRIYNGALSQEDIQLIMISGLSSTATLPNPDNGDTEVVRDTSLSWKEGQYSDTHNVYFGTDFNDVNEASVSDPRGVLVAEKHTDTTFEPLGADILEYNTTYYWRVDEINDSEPNSPWRGETWSFTTLNYLTVDDFESYDDVNNIIYNTWSDYIVNNTGMTVGYIEATSMEWNIKHTGLQSMPLQYDNDGTVNEGTDLEQTGTRFYSEAELRWAEPQDWTRDDIESLTIWLRGNPAKVSSFLEEPPGIFTVKGIGKDIYDRSDEFHFVYKEVEGAVQIIVKVDSMDNTDPFAKAGIMIRDTLDTNAKYCGLFMTPENGVRYQYRT